MDSAKIRQNFRLDELPRVSCLIFGEKKSNICANECVKIGWNWIGSGQDGGMGRNPLLPHTTKRKITTNLKSINNQKCQKIILHGTLTTKELKKESTSPNRLVIPQTERNCSKVAGCVGGAG